MISQTETPLAAFLAPMTFLKRQFPFLIDYYSVHKDLLIRKSTEILSVLIKLVFFNFGRLVISIDRTSLQIRTLVVHFALSFIYISLFSFSKNLNLSSTDQCYTLSFYINHVFET